MKIPDEAPRELVCMRLREMTMVHPDQHWELCSNCHHTVGVYPSGQKALDRYPNIKIICVHCAKPEDYDILAHAAETQDEFEREKRDSKPVIEL